MNRHISITYNGRILTFPGKSAVIIGQSPGCDVKLPNNSQYEDVIFAKILPDATGEGWHIIKTSRFYPVLINGTALNRVHYLSDNDAIDIQGEHLRFNVREGILSAPSITHIHKTGKIVWGIIAAMCVILAFVGYQLYDNQRERITDAMKTEINSSIFTTMVDSLQLVYRDSVVETYIYDSATTGIPVGTAFLTTDSLIVTARHCIQPWLNMKTVDEYSEIPSSKEWPIKNALFAETENQISGQEDWHIISYLTLTDEDGNVIFLNSENFHMNQELDEIVDLSSYYKPRFWRSISHRYNRRDMMLGDIAIARYDKAGKISVANKSELQKLLNHRGVKLMFFGHPESSVNGNKTDIKTDELRIPLEEMQELDGRLFMLAHEGGLTSGFSGGPVIVRDGAGFKAVGIISVVDEKNDIRSYSVPTSEIEFIAK